MPNKFTINMNITFKLIKDSRDEFLVKTTANINSVNPIIDRLMEDDSVGGVIMTNGDGAPILTNMSVTNATNYGKHFHRIGNLTQSYIKELDIFDEVLIVRIKTRKCEIMISPNKEFNIIVMQHARLKTHDISKEQSSKPKF